jgi:hypothetical protein
MFATSRRWFQQRLPQSGRPGSRRRRPDKFPRRPAVGLVQNRLIGVVLGVVVGCGLIVVGVILTIAGSDRS